MSHTCGNILPHLIFSTRERHPLIRPEFQSELFAYLGGIVREMHGTALIINGAADHVHMLVRTRPAQAPAEPARVVKTNSSRWVREKWSPNFGWQTGYGVFSVSESNVTAVRKYIAYQKEHHKKHSFQDEFRAFHLPDAPFIGRVAVQRFFFGDRREQALRLFQHLPSAPRGQR